MQKHSKGAKVEDHEAAQNILKANLRCPWPGQGGFENTIKNSLQGVQGQDLEAPFFALIWNYSF